MLGKVLAAVIGVTAVTAVIASRTGRDEEPSKAATSEHVRDGSAAPTRAERGTNETTVAPSEPGAASAQRDPVIEPTPATREPVEPSSARNHGRATPRSGSNSADPGAASPAPGATDELAAEIRQIAAADRALARGELQRALELAREHAAAHPQGQLVLERTAIELGARCQLGAPGAAEAAAAFLREHADAPAAAKVRTRCAASTNSSGR